MAFYALAVMKKLACYWLDGTDGTDGKEGPGLAGAVTGAPPLAIEGQRAAGSGG